MRVVYLVAALLVAITQNAMAQRVEQIQVVNFGFARTISWVSNIVKTSQLRVGETDMLTQPSVEFMIDIEHKGELITLTPIDFIIKGVDTTAKDREICTSIELASRDSQLPLQVFLDYFRDEKNSYQQKSISIAPCAKDQERVFKRITLESIRFKNTAIPLSVADGEGESASQYVFGVIDPKSGRGICFDLPSGTAFLGRGQNLVAYETIDVPVAKGYKSGRITLGAVASKQQPPFAAYRQMRMDTRFPALSKNTKLIALQKRFAEPLGQYQYLPADASKVDMEGRISNGKGFIFLYNSSLKDTKGALPLSNPSLGLSGQLRLSDWTSLESGVDIGTKSTTDQVEIDVPARGYKIIGVNIDA